MSERVSAAKATQRFSDGQDLARLRGVQAPRVQAALGNANVQLLHETAPAVLRACCSACGGGNGEPLADDVRARAETNFGADFSRVRVHRDASSERAARDLRASAFTVGQDIFFRGAAYAPGTRAGYALLAHELTHTLQSPASIMPKSELRVSNPGDPAEREADAISRRVAAGAGSGAIAVAMAVPMVQRQSADSQALDPSNPYAWYWYERESHRDQSFLATVGAAGGAAKSLSGTLSQSAVPSTDDERKAFERDVRRLITLNAISMVGTHRAELERTKQEFAAMAASPPQNSSAPGPAPATAKNSAADTANAIRSAAKTVTKLNTDKEQLQSLHDDMDGAVRVNAGADAIPEEYQRLVNDAAPRSSPQILQQVLAARDAMSGLSWGSKKVVLLDLRNSLMAFRTRQIQGIDLSLALVYQAFPFFADLPAETVSTGREQGSTAKTVAFGAVLGGLLGQPVLGAVAGYVADKLLTKSEPPADDKLLADVQASFDRLLTRTDEAIVKIGSRDIDPLDLPGAVSATRNMLPELLRPELDRVKQEHEVAQFTKDMILTLGIAVLSGLTAGAAAVGLAAYAAAGGVTLAGIGAAQLGTQLSDMLNRKALSEASTSPDGNLLGVTPPGMFEWAMLGVGAVLTAVDLAGVASEIKALRPHFNEEPHMPAGMAEPNVSALEGEKPAIVPAEQAPREATAGPVKPASPAEAELLEAGRGEAYPSPKQIDVEMGIVEESPRRPVSAEFADDYVEEVELSNGHVWRRGKQGSWCRFSPKAQLCITPQRVAAPGSIKAESDLDALLEPRRPRLDAPPASVTSPEDLQLWEMYTDYFDERVAGIRADFRATGTTNKEAPWDFESFKTRYTEDPKLVAALRGRLAQGRTGNVLSELSDGKVAQNLGISKVANPSPGDVVYPDFVWRGEQGYTAVSNKSRDFRKMSIADIKRVVEADVDEAKAKYFGKRYVRRPGLDVSGQKIDIGEVVLNYTNPELIPERIRGDIFAYAMERGGVGFEIEIGFEF